MSKPSERQSSTPLIRPNTLCLRYSPAAAAQVEAPTDKKGNDSRIIVAQTRGRELIIVCLAPPSAFL